MTTPSSIAVEARQMADWWRGIQRHDWLNPVARLRAGQAAADFDRLAEMAEGKVVGDGADTMTPEEFDRRYKQGWGEPKSWP